MQPNPQAGRDSDQRSWGEWLAWIATEDHCEWANKFVYWIKTPLGVLGLTAAAALACGLWVAPQGYAVLAAIAVVIAVGLVWPWVGIRGLGCELKFASPRARAGRATGVDVTITNRWPWPVWGLAIEDGFFDEAHDRPAVALARIRGWSKSTFRWDFTPEVRGVYPHQAPSLVTEFPFGLWKARRPIAISEQLVVWPDVFWLPPYPQDSSAHDWSGPCSDAHAGQDGERIGVRDHRPGDSMRMIHWAKSAAFDRLVVCEREGASQTAAVVEVDLDPSQHAGEGRDGSLEWAVRIAASVCETLIGQGVKVELRLDRGEQAGLTTGGAAPQLMDALATFDTDAAIRPAVRRSGPVRGQITIRVATDASRRRVGADIVLATRGFGGTRHGARDAAPAWIVIDSPDGAGEQVLRGWRGAGKETPSVA